MSVFDRLKDKASELLQGAGDKVSEATGIDLPIGDVTDQATETAQGLGDTAQGYAESAQGLGDTAQGYADAAGGQVTEATGVELPLDGVGDQVGQATEGINDLGQDVAGNATDRLGEITDPGQK
ncbi:hypothetical protein [Kribbella sancticallisti]